MITAVACRFCLAAKYRKHGITKVSLTSRETFVLLYPFYLAADQRLFHSRSIGRTSATFSVIGAVPSMQIKGQPSDFAAHSISLIGREATKR